MSIMRTEGRPRVRASPKQAWASEAPHFTSLATAMLQGKPLVCPRTPKCTEPAGHPGFCIGHKYSDGRKLLKELKGRR